MTSTPLPDEVDVVVVGAGIVGLAHAAQAAERGRSVAIVERDDHAVGATVRNFGHICASVQTGRALEYAWRARERWLSLGAKADFWVGETGTLVVARTDAQLSLLGEFADLRGPSQVRLLDPDETTERLHGADPAVRGGALLPLDLRVDPRTVAPSLARWLDANGASLHTATSFLGVDGNRVRTSRGDLRARSVVVAAGHDLDRVWPEVADAAGVRRCRLRMLEVAPPDDRRIEPAVLTGLSMLRYDGLAGCPSMAAVRAELHDTRPRALELGMNLMLTQRPDGNLVLGDTHEYGRTLGPFDAEEADSLLLAEGAQLLGVDSLSVRARWHGTYAASDRAAFLVHAPSPDVRLVSVTSGIGMTTAFGLAAEVMTELLD